MTAAAKALALLLVVAAALDASAARDMSSVTRKRGPHARTSAQQARRQSPDERFLGLAANRRGLEGHKGHHDEDHSMSMSMPDGGGVKTSSADGGDDSAASALPVACSLLAAAAGAVALAW